MTNENEGAAPVDEPVRVPIARYDDALERELAAHPERAEEIDAERARIADAVEADKRNPAPVFARTESVDPDEVDAQVAAALAGLDES
jgi:hypothetical protein